MKLIRRLSQILFVGVFLLSATGYSLVRSSQGVCRFFLEDLDSRKPRFQNYTELENYSLKQDEDLRNYRPDASYYAKYRDLKNFDKIMSYPEALVEQRHSAKGYFEAVERVLRFFPRFNRIHKEWANTTVVETVKWLGIREQEHGWNKTDDQTAELIVKFFYQHPDLLSYTQQRELAGKISLSQPHHAMVILQILRSSHLGLAPVTSEINRILKDLLNHSDSQPFSLETEPYRSILIDLAFRALEAAVIYPFTNQMDFVRRAASSTTPEIAERYLNIFKRYFSNTREIRKSLGLFLTYRSEGVQNPAVIKSLKSFLKEQRINLRNVDLENVDLE